VPLTAPAEGFIVVPSREITYTYTRRSNFTKNPALLGFIGIRMNLKKFGPIHLK